MWLSECVSSVMEWLTPRAARPPKKRIRKTKRESRDERLKKLLIFMNAFCTLYCSLYGPKLLE